jgi:hypothetical protein
MSHKRVVSSSRVPRQLCLICAIVDDLVTIAQEDLHAGRWDAVEEALGRMHMQITGDVGLRREGTRAGG